MVRAGAQRLGPPARAEPRLRQTPSCPGWRRRGCPLPCGGRPWPRAAL